jgi:hypothetical protein
MTDLDELMNRDPLELSAQDIDAIVAYQRKARAAFESGVKPKKEAKTASLDSVMETLAPKAEPLIFRRL